MIQSALGLKNARLNIFNDCVKIKLISLFFRVSWRIEWTRLVVAPYQEFKTPKTRQQTIQLSKTNIIGEE